MLLHADVWALNIVINILYEALLTGHRLPELGPHLVAALPHLNVDQLSHWN